MTSHDYKVLAGIVGETLAIALDHGGEANRTVIYYALYEPLTSELRCDNPRFDNLKFAYAVGTAEQAKLAEIRKNK